MLRKRIEIPKCRNKRAKQIASNFLQLDSEDRTIVSVICHHHLSGWTLVGLNVSNRPTRIWSSVNGFEPFRALYVESSKLRNIVLKYKPTIIYLNDAVILSPLSDFTTSKLLVYTGPLDELLHRLGQESARQQARDIKKQKHQQRQKTVPTYEEIRELDANITLRDYELIYKR